MMIMKKFGLMLALAMLFAEGAVLQTYGQDNTRLDSDAVDFSKVDCSALLKMEGDERDYTIIFFQGFMSGRSNNMIVDESDLGKITDEVIDYCVENPDDTVISVFEKYRPVR